MIGGLNPKKMAGMMKRMGIAQQTVNASRVVIESDDGNIIIESPSVMKINMQGQESWQITGEATQKENLDFSDEDVKMVVEKTGASEEVVVNFLKENEGDIALAILELK